MNPQILPIWLKISGGGGLRPTEEIHDKVFDLWIGTLLRFANEQCASREPFPVKPLRWHKLVPVGTGIAEVSVDLAPLP